ncbi:MAG: CCA tRNA nucleotidyltransferase [Dehalococcoidia bacterium]|nr:CCA tRNA nucleotidyltransferase [Dehalococcoidia bacterium]
MAPNVAPLLEAHLAPAALALAQRLGRTAFELGIQTYLVGGPVRDLLLGKPPRELDLAVEGDASALASRLAAAGETEVLMRSQFLTFKLRIAGIEVDLATARRERYASPGALPQVETAPIAEDLGRRDFTINAMAVALSPQRWGELLDPLGGQEDLARGLVRALHDRNFQDDATRILRGLRYEQRLGLRLEEGTERLLRRDVSFLAAISPDRLRHEVERILDEPAPERVFRRAQELGVLSAIHRPLRWEPGLQEATLRLRQRREAHPLAYLSLLAHSLTDEEAKGLVARLNAPVDWRRVVEDVGRLRGALSFLDDPGLRPSEVEAVLKEYAPPALEAALALEHRAHAQRWLQEYLTRLRYVRALLTGDDLLAQGVPAGPFLGRILDALHRARLNGETTSREEEVALVRRLVG